MSIARSIPLVQTGCLHQTSIRTHGASLFRQHAVVAATVSPSDDSFAVFLYNLRRYSSSSKPTFSQVDSDKKRNIGTAAATPFEVIAEFGREFLTKRAISTCSKTTTTTTTTTTTRENQEVNKVQPSGAWHRFNTFPIGAKRLFYDFLRYKHIHDASKTRLNAWTINHPFRKSKSKRAFFIVYDHETSPGRIPRRQYEEQRRVRSDIRTMLPLLIMWVPPIIGFVPLILATAGPRQVLSRQFHSELEVEQYAQIEYQQRESVYIELGDAFWGIMQIHSKLVTESCKEMIQGEDAAGPILDPMVLYMAFMDQNSNTSMGQRLKRKSPPTLPEGVMVSIDELPKEYLVKLSLAMGIHQHLPGWLSPLVTEWSPTSWLTRQVDRVSRTVCHDDKLLLEEDHDLNGCIDLTDVEVMDACLMRGLPINENPSPVSKTTSVADERRQCLTNHLKMIAAVNQQVHGPMSDGLRLFTMHLAPLRYNLKKRLQPKYH